MLKCDADKLQRVFDNLLRNAWAYSYEGTQISIEVRESGDHVELRFSNHGGTIPAEKLERIFEQFYRLDPERGTEGSGLGLCHREADRHPPQRGDYGAEQGGPDGLRGDASHSMRVARPVGSCRKIVRKSREKQLNTVWADEEKALLLLV